MLSHLGLEIWSGSSVIYETGHIKSLAAETTDSFPACINTIKECFIRAFPSIKNNKGESKSIQFLPKCSFQCSYLR